jgi:hypothetical protein
LGVLDLNDKKSKLFPNRWKKRQNVASKIEKFSKKQTFWLIFSILMKKITICGDCFVFDYRVTLHDNLTVYFLSDEKISNDCIGSQPDFYFILQEY